MPADGQSQGRRWIMQHAGRRTVKAGQEIDHTAFRQMDKGRAADGSYTRTHAGRWTGAGQQIVQAVGGQVDN